VRFITRRFGMRKWALLIFAALVVATISAGCMSGGKSDRSSRKAAIGSEPPGALHPRLQIAGNQMNVRAFSWGLNGAQAQQLNIVRLIDANSPPFFRGTAEGTTYRTATLSLIRDDGSLVGTYEFTDVVITSFQNSISVDEPALESLSLSYQKLDFTFTSAHECFDFARGRAC
jgi:type VI protein secretion system component Hcp